ncbi:hypothetical protein MHYP_G00327850 [Metynnis hypsauchen]
MAMAVRNSEKSQALLCLMEILLRGVCWHGTAAARGPAFAPGARIRSVGKQRAAVIENDSFNGTNCEVNLDDCLDHKCQNGGTCMDGVNTYNCQCPPEWTGQFCTDDVDECRLQPNTCQNGGTCSNLPGSYTCVCVNGWSGLDCSENIDDCAAKPCTAGSTCVDRVASFFCSCPFGKNWAGSQCDTNPVNGKFKLQLCLWLQRPHLQ